MDPTNTQLLSQQQDLLGRSISNSKEKLEQLRQAEIQVQEQVKQGKVNEEQYRAFQREIIKAEQELEKLENRAKENSKVFIDVGNKINSAMKTASIAVAGATVALGTVAVKSASEYEESLAKVATIADTTAKSLDDISKEVKETSSITGVSATEINEALYQAISAGADTAYAMDLVNVAVKSAKGGFTDANTAVDGLTTVLNAYNMSTIEAEKLANQFLVTQNKGKTTFGELASSIGKVAPTAKAANIKTEELLSSIAALTANGIATSESITGMKAAISNIIKPSNQASQIASQLGLDFSATAIQTKGLSGFLYELKEKTNGNLETMGQLFGSTEALNTVLTLTSDGGMALMNETMQEMKTNTNALDDAFNTVTSSSKEQWVIITNELKNLSITIGEKLLPMMDNVIMFFRWLIDNSQNIIAIIAGIASGLLAWNVVNMIQNLITGMKKWKIATEGMTIAQQALNLVMNANPIALVTTLVVSLIGAITTLWITNENFRNSLISIWQSIKDLFVNFTNWFFECWNNVKDFFSNLWTNIHKIIVDVWENISNYLLEKIKALTNFITDKFSFMWDSIKLGFSAFKKLFQGDFEGFLSDIWSMATNWVKGWFNIGKNIIQNIWDGIVSLKDWFFNKISNFFSGIVNSVKNMFDFGSSNSSSNNSTSKSINNTGARGFLSNELYGIQRTLLSNTYNNTSKNITNLTQNISFNGDYKTRQGRYIVNDINRQLGLIYK